MPPSMRGQAVSPDLVLGLIFGLLLGGVVAGVSLGVVAHQNYEKYLTMKATAFGLEELLLDAYEGNTDKMWRMRSDGVEVVVERGRPDIHRKESLVDEDGELLDLTWAAE